MPRTASIARGRAARSGVVAADHGCVAFVPRPGRLCQVLCDGTHRKRHTDRLHPGNRARIRLEHTRGYARQDAQRADRVCRRPRQARLAVAHRGPDDSQGGGAGSVVALPGARAQLARSDRSRAEPMADLGGARLVPGDEARRGAERPRQAPCRGRANSAAAAQLPGHDHGILDRAHGLPVVADDLG